jgi:serine/threonine protein kinase
MANRIGEKVIGPNREQFVIEAQIGEGSFGEVYRAVGETSRQKVALKMILPDKLSDPQLCLSALYLMKLNTLY